MVKKTVLKDVQDEIHIIKRLLFRELPPEHFSAKDVVRSFFGAFFIGSTFIFTRTLVEISPLLDSYRIMFIVLSTIGILTAEIYFIGYQRVEDKSTRPFVQFWLKRLVTFYAVGILVSACLAFIYNITSLVGPAENIVKLIVAASMPCSIGASITDLLKKY